MNTPLSSRIQPNKTSTVVTLTALASLSACQISSDSDQERDAQFTATAIQNETSQHATDAYIAGRLATQFALSKHLSVFAIDIDVANGHVVLRGDVPGKTHRDLATELTRGIDEVRGVRNELEIVEHNGPNPDQTASRVERSFSDVSTTARVKTRLIWNESVTGSAIRVSTTDQIVTLSGTLASDVERSLAETIAENTAGVSNVLNEIELDQGSS